MEMDRCSFSTRLSYSFFKDISHKEKKDCN